MNIFLAMIPAFFWGTTYAVTQYTVPDWPPLLLGFVRALPAGLLLFALKPVIPARHQWQPLLILSVINIGAFFAMIFLMAATLPAAISGVGMVSVPIFAMIFQWLWFKKRPSMVQVVSGGILVAFAWFLFDPSQLSLSVVGLVAMFCAICCIVIGSMLTQNLSKDMHWWGVLSWQLIIGGVVLGLVTGLQFWVDPATYQAVLSNDISIRNWAGITWIVLLNTALAYGMYVWLIRKMTVVEFTFSGIANPVAGITGGVLLMNESYSAAQIGLMMGMIAVSLLPNFINLWRTKRRIKVSAVKTENTQDNVPVTD
ncbi:EamA family transporter [Vibrio sp. SCSIO 43132]|uniref:DMT family transporter n=1 Tax=Vibrio sp. SCSIO 43132 TaxID=2779363 RepID=UPI001CA90C04|nr:EamA family transporter [Vibrio sp. SCSIO 43132]UAB73001.1 EamA family transporter [Vibrio sp. SCSIO 43132]